MLKLCFGNPSRETKTKNRGTKQWMFADIQIILVSALQISHCQTSCHHIHLSAKEPLHVGHDGHPFALHRILGGMLCPTVIFFWTMLLPHVSGDCALEHNQPTTTVCSLEVGRWGKEIGIMGAGVYMPFREAFLP